MYKKNGKITKGRAVIAKRFLACLLTVVLCMDLNITMAEAYGEDGTGDALGTISMLSDGLTKNSTVQMVAMGWCYTAMVTKNGELYCCGYNCHGELGNGTTKEQLTPVKVFDNVVYVTHRGYVANLEESVGENGSVVTEYQYDQNNHSDSQFIQEHLKKMDKQEEQTVIVTDGAYSGTENTQLVADKNVKLITTSLTGKPAPDILADFEFNEEGTKVLRCPAGHAPKSCSYMKQSNQCAVSFLHEQCANCPYQDQCKPKIYKRVAKIVTSKAAHERAKIQRNMSSDEFKNYARLRNGVETVPSNIRKNYHLEKIPRGKQRGKFFFGSKVAALNFRKLFNYVKGLGNYTPNPTLA